MNGNYDHVMNSFNSDLNSVKGKLERSSETKEQRVLMKQYKIIQRIIGLIVELKAEIKNEAKLADEDC